MSYKPRVSIGLPVFNGENYLSETLDSILAQTYSDFELIISDNGSFDATGEICRTYATRDERIEYSRNEKNLGAAWNYNRVFHLATGEYFKWAAHDDLCAPEFLERCVEVLDEDPSVVLCYTRTQAIDEDGELISPYPIKTNANSPKPQERFYEFVCVPHPCLAVFGLIRRDALKGTRLIENYASSDRILLGELSLLGRFYEIPEYLFFYRNHLQQSWQNYTTRHEMQAWYDPTKAEKITFPHWRLLAEHLRSIKQASISKDERLWCYLYMGWWVRKHWRFLTANLLLKEP